MSAGAADAMNEGLDLTPAWMRTKVDDEDDTDDGVTLAKPKPLKNAKILPAHQKAATVTGGEDSWQGGSWTWLAQTGQRPPTLMERLAQLPESLPGGPVPDYFVPGPGFEGEETAEEREKGSATLRAVPARRRRRRMRCRRRLVSAEAQALAAT